MNELPNGTSRRVHADALLADVELRFAEIAARLRNGRRLRPADRETLSRRLSGVVGGCEGLRAWLNDGARE